MLIRVILLFAIIPSISVAAPVKTAHVELELVSEVESIQPGKSFWVGIRFNLAEDWHIYWQNPGDAGMAPKFKWNVPKDFRVGEIQWPYPKRIVTSGLASFAYEGEVILLVEMMPAKKMTYGSQVSIRVHLDWLECKDVCIPGAADLALSLAIADKGVNYDAKWQNIFNKTRSMLPVSDSNWQLKATLSDSNIVIIAKAPADLRSDIQRLEFFPFSSEIFINAEEQKFITNKEGYSLSQCLSPTLLQIPERLSGILVADTSWSGAKTAKALIIDLPIVKTPIEFPLKKGVRGL
jgi:thiol:disulfide interchange protein DsbD